MTQQRPGTWEDGRLPRDRNPGQVLVLGEDKSEPSASHGLCLETLAPAQNTVHTSDFAGLFMRECEEWAWGLQGGLWRRKGGGQAWAGPCEKPAHLDFWNKEQHVGQGTGSKNDSGLHGRSSGACGHGGSASPFSLFWGERLRCSR